MRRLLIAASLTLATAAAGSVVGGINIDDSINIGERKLVLNGAAVRKKFVVKVYVGALYLASKETNAAAILAADSPRRMVMHLLYDVDRGKMAEAWQEALAANTPNASAEVKTAFRTLSGWMEDMKEGQRIVLTYVPGSGTIVEVNGRQKGTLPGKATADAILATWIGPKPGPGADFRKAVLGQ